jgi:hypothetical protein
LKNNKYQAQWYRPLVPDTREAEVPLSPGVQARPDSMMRSVHPGRETWKVGRKTTCTRYDKKFCFLNEKSTKSLMNI